MYPSLFIINVDGKELIPYPKACAAFSSNTTGNVNPSLFKKSLISSTEPYLPRLGVAIPSITTSSAFLLYSLYNSSI
ncbi:hypothetical protein CBU02nite_38700 [Clostridium butyricum]|uniref:Uncharacterized protein n=1 Tax=Clostridium butyricum TaxID=1492 RepID=A0A512TSV1_CLOBU|nr:hypothetical protein [Clostridium butyricum]GEQ23364.1 hypothetical protein CBU02nite_38700 [Clostridium butyricum]